MQEDLFIKGVGITWKVDLVQESRFWIRIFQGACTVYKVGIALGPAGFNC